MSEHDGLKAMEIDERRIRDHRIISARWFVGWLKRSWTHCWQRVGFAVQPVKNAAKAGRIPCAATNARCTAAHGS